MQKHPKQQARKNKKLILSDLLMLVCVCLLLYPMAADLWNEQHNSSLYAQYQEKVDALENEDELLENANAYNQQLLQRGDDRFRMTKEERKEYKKLLKIPKTDVMAYLDVPAIGIENLAVYHSTNDTVLQAGIGHMEGSSLPIGGTGTHSVLMGHTGMAGNPLFSKLDKLKIGDIFQIKILHETLTYEVDQIETVLPTDLSLLQIDPERDDCTLITCTPIGVNSHRLLVRGKRIPNPEDGSDGKGQNILQWLMTRFSVYELGMAAAALVILLVFLLPDLVRGVRRKKK